MAYHNVSVRLDENEYKQLLFLQDKFNRFSYGKTSLADVLRHSITDAFLHETSDLSNPVINIAENKQKALELLKVDGEEETKLSHEEIAAALTEYETELRKGINSKKKPYTEAYIKKQLETKRKELQG